MQDSTARTAFVLALFDRTALADAVSEDPAGDREVYEAYELIRATTSELRLVMNATGSIVAGTAPFCRLLTYVGGGRYVAVLADVPIVAISKLCIFRVGDDLLLDEAAVAINEYPTKA